MKKTDLEKLKGLKIAGQMGQSATPARFGKEAVSVVNRREQRKLDQAQGLVPFACKLDGELVKKLNALAVEREVGVGVVLAELLGKALAK